MMIIYISKLCYSLTLQREGILLILVRKSATLFPLSSSTCTHNACTVTSTAGPWLLTENSWNSKNHCHRHLGHKERHRSTKEPAKRIISHSSNLSSWNTSRGKTFFPLVTFNYKLYMYGPFQKEKNFTTKRVFQVIQG